jgi:hypothetical protein
MKAVEEASSLRVGGGGVSRRRRRCGHSPDLEGWPGRRRTSEGGAWGRAGQRGVRERADRPTAGEVDGGLGGGGATVGWPEVEKKTLY